MNTYTTGASDAAHLTGFTGRVTHGEAIPNPVESARHDRGTTGLKKKGNEDRRRELERALSRSQRSSQRFDQVLLDHANELLESMDTNDQVTATVNLAEIGAIVAGFWEMADRVTPTHKMILAALDAGILAALSADSISSEELAVFRVALSDLSMPIVSEIQAEDIRSRLIDLGKKPLFIVSNVRDDFADDEDTKY